MVSDSELERSALVRSPCPVPDMEIMLRVGRRASPWVTEQVSEVRDLLFFWPFVPHRNRNENLSRKNCEPVRCSFLAGAVRCGGCSSLVSSGRCNLLLSFLPTSEMNGSISLRGYWQQGRQSTSPEFSSYVFWSSEVGLMLCNKVLWSGYVPHHTHSYIGYWPVKWG